MQGRRFREKESIHFRGNTGPASKRSIAFLRILCASNEVGGEQFEFLTNPANPVNPV